MKKRRLKKKFKLFLKIYFIILTFSFSVLTLSKYVSKVEGDGGLKVAKWEVKLDTNLSSDTFTVVMGNGSQNYKLKVYSTSEVGVSYSIVLSNIPNGVQVSLDGATPLTPTNNKITFSNVGQFDANGAIKSREHTLSFSAILGSNEISDTDINMDVVFIQRAP